MYLIGTLFFNGEKLGIVLSYNKEECLLVIGYDKNFLLKSVKSHWGSKDFNELESCIMQIHSIDLEMESQQPGAVFTGWFAYSVYENIRVPQEQLTASYQLLKEAKYYRNTFPLRTVCYLQDALVYIEVGDTCRIMVLKTIEHVDALLQELNDLVWFDETTLACIKRLKTEKHNLPDTSSEVMQTIDGFLAEVLISILSSVLYPANTTSEIKTVDPYPWRSNYMNN